MKNTVTAPKTDLIHPPTGMLDILRSIFRRKWTIAGICLATGIGAAIIVLILPVYYRSSTTFLAVSPDQATPELLFGDGTIPPELYGNANDIDRLLTISESNELVNFMIDSFNLYQHYDIDAEHARASYYVRQAFFDLYEIKKTKRDALQLSIEDTSPDQSAAMANAARKKINGIAQRLIKQGQKKTIRTFEENIEAKNKQLLLLDDSLVQMRNRFGIYNLISQSEVLTSQLSSTENSLVNAKARKEAFQSQNGKAARDSVQILTVRIAGIGKQLENQKERLSIFNSGLSQVRNYEQQYREATETISEDQERLKQYRAAANSDIGALLLVEEAEKPVIKFRPKRTLVVIGSVLVAFFFSVIGVLLFETYQEINWREIYHGR